MRITFYLSKDPLEPFMNIVMPIMYCAIANTLNFWFFFNIEDKPDFVANALTLGLTLVFLIPTISNGRTSTITNEFDFNELIIVFRTNSVMAIFTPGKNPKINIAKRRY